MLAFLRDDEGQGLVEYALIIAVIAITLIVAMIFLRGQITNIFSNIGNNLTLTLQAAKYDDRAAPPRRRPVRLLRGQRNRRSASCRGRDPGRFRCRRRLHGLALSADPQRLYLSRHGRGPRSRRARSGAGRGFREGSLRSCSRASRRIPHRVPVLRNGRAESRRWQVPHGGRRPPWPGAAPWRRDLRRASWRRHRSWFHRGAPAATGERRERRGWRGDEDVDPVRRGARAWHPPRARARALRSPSGSGDVIGVATPVSRGDLLPVYSRPGEGREQRDSVSER